MLYVLKAALYSYSRTLRLTLNRTVKAVQYGQSSERFLLSKPRCTAKAALYGSNSDVCPSRTVRSMPYNTIQPKTVRHGQSHTVLLKPRRVLRLKLHRTTQAMLYGENRAIWLEPNTVLYG